jgi:hypothetical protein
MEWHRHTTQHGNRCGGQWNGICTPLHMLIDVADADATPKGIFPCAKSSSFTVTGMID